MTAQYAVGDTIVLTKGDDRLVREVEGDLFIIVGTEPFATARVRVTKLTDTGWVVESVKPKPAPLPTEPGWYKYDGGDFDPFLLHSNGVWEDRFGVPIDPRNALELSNPRLTRLIPESDLSEKLTEARREVVVWLEDQDIAPWHVIEALREKFGADA